MPKTYEDEPTPISSEQNLASLGRYGVEIPCRTSSDALLTALVVDMDMDSISLQAILSLLREHSFNSKDVSFSSFEDVSNYISIQRQRIAHDRALKSTQPPVDDDRPKPIYGVVPDLIVELVTKQLGRERTPMIDRIDWDVNVFSSSSRQCARTNDLRNMALVHRTWTLPAQAVLRSRADIVGTKSLRSFFRGLYAGPWLREIYFATMLDNEDPNEMLELLTMLLKKCTRLRTLCLYTSFRLHHQFDPFSFGKVVEQLQHLTRLENLWLVQDRGHIACLPILCTALPALKNLKYLYIKNWMGNRAGVNQEATRVDKEALERQLATTAGGLNLSSLSFVDGWPGDWEMTAKFIPWLFRKSGTKSSPTQQSSMDDRIELGEDCPLRHLEIHTKDLHTEAIGTFTPLHSSLRPLLSNIITLRLHCSAIYLQGTLDFVSCCTSLKTLSLVVGLSTDFSQFLLPMSISHVHVHFCTIWPVNGLFMKEKLEDRNVLPNLRTLRLTKDPLDLLHDTALVPNEAERMAAAWHIDELTEVCQTRGIHLTNAYEFLSFAALSEIATQGEGEAYS